MLLQLLQHFWRALGRGRGLALASPRSSASSIGFSQSGLAAEELWEKELAERHNALVSRQQNHERKVRQRAAGSIVNRAFD